MDDKHIYPLLNNQPVLIEVNDYRVKIVVSDGFHFTKPIELDYGQPGFYNFKVVSPVNDLQLLGGAFVMTFLYLLGFLTGLLLIKIFSFIPILLLLFIFYINRKSFIRLRQDEYLLARNNRGR